MEGLPVGFAVGELLAKLEIESAQIDATGSDMVKVHADGDTWVIGESYSATGSRGKI